MIGKKNCSNPSDYKFICPECWQRFFLTEAAVKHYSESPFSRAMVASCPHCQMGDVRFDATDEKKEWYGAVEHLNAGPKPRPIYDLVYVGTSDTLNEFTKLVATISPQLQCEKEWDIVHEYRVGVSVPSLLVEQYLATILVNGYYDISLHCRMGIATEGKPFADKLIDITRKYFPDKVKDRVNAEPK